MRGGVTFQRFVCTPANGDARHTFQAPLVGSAVAQPEPYSPPERCALHPTSHTIRSGKTRTARGVERQRYECFPNNGDAPHRFTPTLSRLVVDHGDTCPECTALRGVNQGETNAARGHKFTSRVVAGALDRLAGGASYGATALWAQGAMTTRHTHGPPPMTPGGPQGKRARTNAWRLTADWVETFSPVLWTPWAAAARRQVDEALAGPVKDRPIVTLLLDDIPIFQKSYRTAGSKQRFAVLAASESFVDLDKGTRVTRLRLLRAYPNHTADAYKLVLAELGYVPDIIMADGGQGIASAVRWLRKEHPDQPFQRCLSAYHLRMQLRRQFTKLAGDCGFQAGDLVDRLENWSFIESEGAWLSWWADYEARLAAQRIPEAAKPHQWIRDVKPVVDAQMSILDEHRILPRSTGALEATLFRVVKPSMSGRAQGFGNLERTNRLLDLMTMKANGAFDNLGPVAAQLAEDAKRHGGYVPPVRSIADVRMHRTLLDETTTARLAKQAGL